MMIRIGCFLLMLSCMVVPWAKAQPEQPEHLAEASLTAVEIHIKSNLATHYSFVQTRTLSLLSRPVISEGELEFDAGSGMCWVTLKPFYSKLHVSQNGIFELNKDGSKQRLMPSGHDVFEVFSQVYKAIFAGEFDDLDNSFNVLPRIEGDAWQLTLQPYGVAEMAWLKEIELSGDGKHSRLLLIEQAGDSTELFFKPLSQAGEDLCW